jgi:hypothetical protein
MPNLSTLGSSSSLDGLVTNKSLPNDTVVLKISKPTIGNVKQATMFVLTTATLAAGLLAQLPQLGVSANLLQGQKAQTYAVTTSISIGLLSTLKNSNSDEIKNAVQAILEFATGKYSVTAAEDFYNELKAQAQLTLP